MTTSRRIRVAITGASGVLGRGIAARLLSRGHDVVGLSRSRPESWSSAAEFIEADIRDGAAVRRAVAGADVVAHCAWAKAWDAEERDAEQLTIDGAATVLDAMAETGTGRIVFASSASAGGGTRDGRRRARVEQMLAGSGAHWVAIRSALMLGRGVDNSTHRLLSLPAFPRELRDRAFQVIHTEDASALFVRAVLDQEIGSGPINLAAPGELTVGRVADRLGRPVVPAGGLSPLLRRSVRAFGQLAELCDAPPMDISRLSDEFDFRPAWTASECLADFAPSARGRLAVGSRVLELRWRVQTIQDLPTVDAPSPDGMVPKLAGPQGDNGEFDTPVDPRFPTFLATNLSEALPGPFSPSSASATVRGLRASGARIARRLGAGGVIQHEMAARTVAVFAHRLYGAITTAHYMAEIVPLVKPETFVGNSGYFGPSMASLPLFGDQRPPSETRFLRRQLRNARNLAVAGFNVVCLTAGSGRDTRDFAADVDRLERLAGADLACLDDRRLLALILLARDHVVQGWMLSSGSFLMCAVYNVSLRLLSGREAVPPAGRKLVSARSVEAVRRLVEFVRRDPDASRLLADSRVDLAELAARAPKFYAALTAELRLIGHRGPAELEMLSTSFADDPELLVRMVTKALAAPPPEQPRHSKIPLHAKPIAVMAASQIREREARRDKTVRANWVLRGLLREYGRRLSDAGVFAATDDVFYLLIDELDAVPDEPAGFAQLVARRRAERRRLVDVVPPPVISGYWQPTALQTSALGCGETLRGAGVCGGRVRGRVRIVRPETIDDLQPGEVLVAEVTDVGYTAAFCYAAAVVTELGGPMSHAAVVAREFGFPCVVDAHGATRLLPEGALVEVDGGTGEIRVLG